MVKGMKYIFFLSVIHMNTKNILSWEYESPDKRTFINIHWDNAPETV